MDATFRAARTVLGDVLEALGPYREHIIVIGGWVPVLYLEGLPQEFTVKPLFTSDIDIGAPERIAIVDDMPIRSIVEKLGFAPERHPVSQAVPPLTKFVMELGDGSGVDLEFLTDLTGSGELQTAEIQPGLSGQRLRYLRILLDHPWPIAIPKDPQSDAQRTIELRVPQPGAYILHKGLIQREDVAKEKKDLAYIYQVLDGFSSSERNLANEVAEVAAGYPSKWARRFRMRMDELFLSGRQRGMEAVLEQLAGVEEMPKATLRRRINRTIEEFVAGLENALP